MIRFSNQEGKRDQPVAVYTTVRMSPLDGGSRCTYTACALARCSAESTMS